MLNRIFSNSCSISDLFFERKRPTWKSVAFFAATFFVTLVTFVLRYGKKKSFTKGSLVLTLGCSVGVFVLHYLYFRKKSDCQAEVQLDLAQTETPEVENLEIKEPETHTSQKNSHPLDASTEPERERLCRYFSDPNHSTPHLVEKFEQGFAVLTMEDLEEAETVFYNFASQNLADNQSNVEQYRSLQDIAYLKSLKTDWEKDQLQKMFLSEWSSLCEEIDEKKETLNRQNQMLEGAVDLMPFFVAINRSITINHAHHTDVSNLHSSIAMLKSHVDHLNTPLLNESYKDLESRLEVFEKKFDEKKFNTSFRQSFKDKRKALQDKGKEYSYIFEAYVRLSRPLRFISGYRGTENLEELKVLLKKVNEA